MTAAYLSYYNLTQLYEKSKKVFSIYGLLIVLPVTEAV